MAAIASFTGTLAQSGSLSAEPQFAAVSPQTGTMPSTEAFLLAETAPGDDLLQWQGEGSPAAQDDREELAKEGDPQRLLALLLGAPLTPQPQEIALQRIAGGELTVQPSGDAPLTTQFPLQDAALQHEAGEIRVEQRQGDAPLDDDRALINDKPIHPDAPLNHTLPLNSAVLQENVGPQESSRGSQINRVQASSAARSADMQPGTAQPIMTALSFSAALLQPAAVSGAVLQKSDVPRGLLHDLPPAAESLSDALQSDGKPKIPSPAAEITEQNAAKQPLPAAGASSATKPLQLESPAALEPQLMDRAASPSAPAVVNALLKSDAADGKLPPVSLPAAPEQQAEALQNALAGRLQLQIDRRVQQATIRLDPPSLGKVELSIHFESGKLQVHIQAAQPEVARLLQQTSGDLRASLSEQNNVQVNVQVSTQSGDGRRQPRHGERSEAAIAENNEEQTTRQRGTDGTILTMV